MDLRYLLFPNQRKAASPGSSLAQTIGQIEQGQILVDASIISHLPDELLARLVEPGKQALLQRMRDIAAHHQPLAPPLSQPSGPSMADILARFSRPLFPEQMY